MTQFENLQTRDAADHRRIEAKMFWTASTALRRGDNPAEAQDELEVMLMHSEWAPVRARCAAILAKRGQPAACLK